MSPDNRAKIAADFEKFGPMLLKVDLFEPSLPKESLNTSGFFGAIPALYDDLSAARKVVNKKLEMAGEAYGKLYLNLAMETSLAAIDNPGTEAYQKLQKAAETYIQVEEQYDRDMEALGKIYDDAIKAELARIAEKTGRFFTMTDAQKASGEYNTLLMVSN